MNEINIRIILNNDYVFPSCYIGQLLDIVLGILNTYEIETENIEDLRLTQHIDKRYIPFVFHGKSCASTFSKIEMYQHPSQRSSRSSSEERDDSSELPEDKIAEDR